MPDNLAALVLGMYSSWNMWCSIASTIYHPSSPCGSHDARSSGLLLMTIIFPVGDNGMQL